MLIIVDSGSTKADWQIIHPDGSRELQTTIGMNPFFFSEDDVQAELRKDFVNKVAVGEARRIYFYGAGCSDAMRCAIIRRAVSHAES